MAGRRRRRRRSRAAQSATPEGGSHLGANGGEQGSSGQSRASATAEAQGHLGGNDGGVGAGKSDARPHAVATGEEEGRLGAKGREGARSAGPPRAVVVAAGDGGANDEGVGGMATAPKEEAAEDRVGGSAGLQRGVVTATHGGAKDEGGQPRTVAMAEEGEGHVGAHSGGRDGAGESNGDQALDSLKGGCFLTDAVLKWRVEDVMNPDIFREKVKKIPAEFGSPQQYQEIHSALLLEETRASIQFAMLQPAKVQSYRAISVSCTDTPYLFYIDIDLRSLDGCYHVAEDGDLFFLSSQPLKQMDISGCFAVAVEIGRDTCFQKSFRVLVSEKNPNFDTIMYASFLTNITKAINISKAITSVGRDPSGIVESVLRMEEKVKRKCSSCGECALEDSVDPTKFNDEQLNVVKSIVSKLQCPHVNAAEIVWGPPGTGKTQVAIAIIHSLLHWRSRTLVCIPRKEDIPRFFAQLKEVFPAFNLSKILVLNALNDMENCSSFAEASLEIRTQKLYCSIYVWKSWMKEMAFVLRMKPYCLDNCDHDDHTCSKSKLIVFRFESFREKVSALVLDLRQSSLNLISSLSAISLSEIDIVNINELLSNLSDFENLLLNDGVTSSDVQKAFGFASVSASNIEKDDIAKLLDSTRMSCLKLLDALVDTISIPQLEDRNELEEFCIQNSSIIICTPSCSFRLQDLKLKSIDILLVDDAAQIKESDLLIPLSIAPRHVVLLGDHLHVQAMVKSKVCEEAGYASSLFERLLGLSSDKIILSKQYVMHPFISQFVRQNFYGGNVEDGCTVESHAYNKQVDKTKLPSYGFFDITQVDELRVKGKDFVEYVVLVFLLQKLYKGLKNKNEKLKVGIVYLCSNRVGTAKDQLSSKYGSHKTIDLEVNFLDNLNESWYDVVILSTVFYHKAQLPDKISTALTRARLCLWIIGEGNDLCAAGDIWEKLVNNAVERRLFATLTSSVLSSVMKNLELNIQDKPTVVDSSLPENIMQKPGQEFTWKGRPHNRKDILAQVRDQKDARDTCTFQASLGAIESLNKFQCSCFNPPQAFTFDLCFDDLKTKYEQIIKGELTSEERKNRGKRRLETSLDIAKDEGIVGSDSADQSEKRERLFKIESYELVDAEEEGKAESLLEAGNIMIGTFRVSRNYFYLKPGETYKYDKSIPYIHAKSGLPGAHAVMVIGHGKQQPSPEEAKGTSGQSILLRHVHFQNSEGRRFGIDGFGRVFRCSLRGLYHVTLPTCSV
ncbi:hypothetical protein ACP70R_007926 [Stipagrostis hirtigluma subsp. patula]